MRHSAAKKTTTRSKAAPDLLASFERFPLVHVVWRDAAHSGADGWQSHDVLEIPLLAAEAAGFLIHDGPNKYGEDCICLASAIVLNTEGKPDCCLSFVIPRAMIVSLKEVKV